MSALIAPALALLLVACASDTTTSVITREDASVGTDAPAIPSDGTAPSPDGSTPGCGEFTGDTRTTCSKDGNVRGQCINGSPQTESCARGCLRNTAPADDVCMGTTTTWSCTGSYGTTRAQDGDYYLTAFGCWIDAASVVHTDPGDNCIPACLSKAQSAGVCMKGDTGPQCEESTDWYVADSGRFGCVARLRVENPKNGKKAIVVVLDAGPACSVEANVQKAVLDASGRVNEYLFGTQNGWSDRALVHVVEVDPSTPLGPI